MLVVHGDPSAETRLGVIGSSLIKRPVMIMHRTTSAAQRGDLRRARIADTQKLQAVARGRMLSHREIGH